MLTNAAQSYQITHIEATRLEKNMAEPFGTIAGALSVAALFNNCVQCFEYIQSGRKFGDDFERYLLRVDSARLRLERWGKGAGINQDPRFETDKNETADDLSLHVYKVLGQVMLLFEKLHDSSRRFEVGAKDRRGGPAKASTSRSLGADGARIDAEESIRQRQKRTSIGMKTRWALYEKKNFDKLSQDLSGFLDDLERILPASSSKAAPRPTSASSTLVHAKDEAEVRINVDRRSSAGSSTSEGFPRGAIASCNTAEVGKCRGRTLLQVGNIWSAETAKRLLLGGYGHKTVNTVTCVEIQGEARIHVGNNYGY